MSVYVITGGTRGIGFGIARELLGRGQRVFICGRTQEAVDEALAKLGSADARGAPCDVASQEQVLKLWDSAVVAFGRVDVWVNNAAVDPHTHVLDASQADVDLAIDINLKGALFGCQAAIQGMARQPDGGRVYIMEGFGSDGRQGDAAMAIYGASKYGLTYMATAIDKDVQEKHGRKVVVGRLSPGMVPTDLLKKSLQHCKDDSEKFKKTKHIINLLADDEKKVTSWLADQLVAKKKEARWLTGSVVGWRFLTACCLRRPDLFPEETVE